jgi:hypothetical protein
VVLGSLLAFASFGALYGLIYEREWGRLQREDPKNGRPAWKPRERRHIWFWVRRQPTAAEVHAEREAERLVARGGKEEARSETGAEGIRAVESGPMDVTGSGDITVARSEAVRVLEAVSLAVRGIVVGIILAVFFGVWGVTESLAAALAATVLAVCGVVFVFKVEPVQNEVTRFARWLTNRP